MSGLVSVLCGLGAWVALAVPVALITGRALRRVGHHDRAVPPRQPVEARTGR